MQAFARLLAVTLVVTVPLAALAAEGDKVTLKKGDKILFLGDSITAGGVSPKGYVTLFKKAVTEKYKDLGLEIIGAGISGNKVPDLQRRLERDVLKKKPSVVVIYIGINDVWHGENDPKRGTSKEAYQAGLIDIIGKIKASGAQVVLCTPTVIGEKPDGSNKNDPKLDEYADISRKVAKETKSILVDLRQAFLTYLKENNKDKKDKGVLTTDRVHLNPAGNKVVAEEILKVF